MKYYSFYPEENDANGVAYAPEGVSFKLLYRKGIVANWQTIEFTLKDGMFTDYQWNNMGWHMCSEKLKTLLTGCAGPDDFIQWLPVVVKNITGEQRNYHVLHLPIPCDVLSKTRTIMSGNIVVKPVLNASKIESHSIFTYSDEGIKVYIAESIRKRIRTAKITGLDFLTVPTITSE